MHTTYAEDEFDKIDLPTTTNPYIKIAKLLLKYNLFNEIEICVDNIIKLCNDYFNGKESIVKYAKDEVLKFFNPAKVK